MHQGLYLQQQMPQIHMLQAKLSKTKPEPWAALQRDGTYGTGTAKFPSGQRYLHRRCVPVLGSKQEFKSTFWQQKAPQTQVSGVPKVQASMKKCGMADAQANGGGQHAVLPKLRLGFNHTHMVSLGRTGQSPVKAILKGGGTAFQLKVVGSLIKDNPRSWKRARSMTPTPVKSKHYTVTNSVAGNMGDPQGENTSNRYYTKSSTCGCLHSPAT
ncbi:hypothetical protein KQX54_000705 [Cotesia glomerata]|uniref:Uncharacterized protein n=1 Tax=Cotesia glomerata TaxID=32391 RepID=A0AAV7IK83_COTGL|nr:hypothetical protein KQX54_000705 [Cotesia glomerata]